MGVAEAIPGVSGGTIAFITGIYDRLIAALAGYSSQSIQLFRKRGFVSFWHAHDLTFLALLVLGMVVSFLGVARIMEFLINSYGLFVFACLFGVIVGSVFKIGVGVPLGFLSTFGIAGTALGAGLSIAGPMEISDPSYLRFLFGGALAVVAWILPGISGGFVLLLLGLYVPFLHAVNDLQFDILGAIIVGMIVGLLLFSKVVSYVLGRWRTACLALLTGLLVGSLFRLWPWRVADDLTTPWSYENTTGDEAMVLGVTVAALVGVGIALLIGKNGEQGR